MSTRCTGPHDSCVVYGSYGPLVDHHIRLLVIVHHSTEGSTGGMVDTVLVHAERRPRREYREAPSRLPPVERIAAGKKAIPDSSTEIH